MTKKSMIIFWLLGGSFILGMLGCRIDHYAWVRVSVKDIDTGEPITNGNCEVSCNFPCFDISRMFSWDGQRSFGTSKRMTSEDGGAVWLFGHGNTAEASAYLYSPPDGYYRSNEKGDDGNVHFSTLMSFIPIPLHFPPIQFATVYAKRQCNAIDATIHHMVEECGPKTNGVFLGEYKPDDYKADLRVSDYEVSMGFDLMAGDYCPPYGKGEYADIVFRHSYEDYGMKTNYAGTLVHDYVRKRIMVFPGKGNGLVFRERPTMLHGRNFTRDDFTAPADGYQQEAVSAYGREHIGPIHAFFMFRIRSQYDEAGNMTSCHYGCWKGRFSYYLHLYGDYFVNPTPMDRNLELRNGTAQDGGAIWHWW